MTEQPINQQTHIDAQKAKQAGSLMDGRIYFTSIEK